MVQHVEALFGRHAVKISFVKKQHLVVTQTMRIRVRGAVLGTCHVYPFAPAPAWIPAPLFSTTIVMTTTACPRGFPSIDMIVSSARHWIRRRSSRIRCESHHEAMSTDRVTNGSVMRVAHLAVTRGRATSLQCLALAASGTTPCVTSSAEAPSQSSRFVTVMRRGTLFGVSSDGAKIAETTSLPKWITRRGRRRREGTVFFFCLSGP